MNKILIKMACIGFIIIVIGCDGRNTYEYRINNQTSNSISIKYKIDGKQTDAFDSLRVPPNSSALLYKYSVTTSSNPAPDIHRDTIRTFSYLSVIGFDTLVSFKNMRSRSEWDFRYTETWAEYSIIIDSTDF